MARGSWVLAARLTLLVALLRYAIDLLGVVFVIILVGFAIRAISDWLTEGESVSGWAMSALSLGLMGTVLVGLWLFNSRGDRVRASQRLPGPIQRTVAWLESQGWGQRVLLPGGTRRIFERRFRRRCRSASGGAGPPAAASVPASRCHASQTPSSPAAVIAAVTRPTTRRAPRSRPARRGSRRRQPHRRAAPAPVPPAVVPTSITSHGVALSCRRGTLGAADRAGFGASEDSGAHGHRRVPPDDAVLGRATVRNGTAVLVDIESRDRRPTAVATYDGDSRHLPSRVGLDRPDGRSQVMETEQTMPDANPRVRCRPTKPWSSRPSSASMSCRTVASSTPTPGWRELFGYQRGRPAGAAQRARRWSTRAIAPRSKERLRQRISGETTTSTHVMQGVRRDGRASSSTSTARGPSTTAGRR